MKKTVFIIISVLLNLSFANLYINSTLDIINFKYLIILLYLLIGSILFFISYKLKSNLLKTLSITFILIIVISPLICDFIIEKQESLTFKNANLLNKKIEEYKNKNGEYPKELSNLLKQDGDLKLSYYYGFFKYQYQYKIFKDINYSLEYRVKEGVYNSWLSEKKIWFKHD